MKRLPSLVLAAMLSAGSASAYGQADARGAFDAGKQAYAAGQFDRAREQFQAASQTDAQNPEVFLWLGKANYQLGAVDDAIAAWTTTLKLAPGEPYANRMLAALRGNLTQADGVLSLIDVLLRQQLNDAALRQVEQFLAQKSLSDEQRVKAIICKGQALLALGRAKDVSPLVHELQVKYPKLSGTAEIRLLLGQAYVRMGGTNLNEGLELLRQVASGAESEAASTARYELLAYDLRQGVTPARVDTLARWIGENAQHASVSMARMRLVEAHLAVAAQCARPRADSSLAGEDTSALAAAADVYRQLVLSEESLRLTQQMIEHIDARYAKNQAYAAAVAATDALLKANLPQSSRQAALIAAGRYRAEAALQHLAGVVASRTAVDLKAQPLPQSLADTLAVYDAINREFPSQAQWKQRADLADRLRQLAASMDWPARHTALKPPLAWAVQIALPVAAIPGDEEAAAAATNTIVAIVDEVASLKGREAGALAAGVHGQLLAAVPANSSRWLEVAWRQADLLDAQAVALFQENTRAGRIDQNAKLSEPQQQMLDVFARVVARQSQSATKAVERFSSHIKPWVEQGHYDLAEAAYGQLEKTLPEVPRKTVRLAMGRLWVARVLREHERMLTAGLAPSRQLEPILKQAMAEFYTLQAGLDEADPLIVEVRNAWEGVVFHYKKLQYFDVAEQAIAVKGSTPVAAADAHAALQLAHLRREQADRQLQQLLKQYDGARKLTLTSEHRAAIGAYQQYISSFPSHLRADEAAAAVLSIAGTFEDLRAYDVAAEVYQDLAAFAAKQPPLAKAAPGTASIAEKSAFAAAQSLDAKARAALAKALQQRRPGEPPPTKLSDESAAAIAAYKGFIKSRPASVLVAAAIQKIMAMALEHARAEAWDVADSIFADLLNAGLPLRNPERLDFSRALCQIGKVMPDHAREVLTALTFGKSVWDAEIGLQQDLRIVGRQTRTELLEEINPFDVVMSPPPPELVPQKPASESVAAINEVRQADVSALAAIGQQQSRLASRVAALRDQPLSSRSDSANTQSVALPQQEPGPSPAISGAELARIEEAFDAAYKILKFIRDKHPGTITAEQARAEVLLMASHWRTLSQWQQAAALMQRYLTDNPYDRQLPQLRLQIAHDYLGWAAQGVQGNLSSQSVLAEITRRFDEARKQLSGVIASFPDSGDLRQQAQWDLAASFLTQARSVDAFSPTLSRGQFVRAAREAERLAIQLPDHPKTATVPEVLWQIGNELASRGYFDEAITVWGDLTNLDPTHALSQQAAPKIAEAYQNKLNRPLRAIEAYLELNFARGGNDTASQDAVFEIGSRLKGQKRWVEAMNALETFVNTFPRHPNAGLALTMTGQIHQANEAWQDAIVAYSRVIDEYPSGNWVQEAKWAIAECTINLSQWREAMAAYEGYIASYQKDSKVAEATRRIGILKDLARYQTLVDEPGQRKAFDAQYQIASIIQSQLANPQKAIIEFRKVTTSWPQSHLADDALHAIGSIYLGMGETDRARVSLMAVARQYPDSPLADDAMVLVGRSYEEEAQKLAALTRGATVQEARERAQKDAYLFVQNQRSLQRSSMSSRIQQLKKGGKSELAELEEANRAAARLNFDNASIDVALAKAKQDMDALTAAQLADRQDKINTALRRAVEAYAAASRIPGGDKAGDALLRMAVIYNEQLKDSAAALTTWKEIVNQFSGTAVAEEASWQIAQYYERQGNYAEAVEAYKAFLRNYRRSPKAGQAQFAVAEGYEHLNKWVEAMDAYTNYLNSFADGPLVQKAREQINWIKTYRL